MTVREAKAEVFWTAFKSLSKPERNAVLERFLRNKQLREDLLDVTLIEKRHNEPSRPLKDYLAEHSKRPR